MTEAKPGGSAMPGILVLGAGGDSSWATQMGTPDFVEAIVLIYEMAVFRSLESWGTVRRIVGKVS
jgi:hypothetical protein